MCNMSGTIKSVESRKQCQEVCLPGVECDQVECQKVEMLTK